MADGVNVMSLQGELTLNDEDFQRGLNNAQQGMQETAEAVEQAGQEIGESVEETTEEYSSNWQRTFETIGNAARNVTNIITSIGSVALAAIRPIANGISQLVQGAVDSYGEYEQLVGGVETLFGDAADTVIENAQKAFSTAQMSANDYLQTVTSFSASLIQGLKKSSSKMSAE